MAVIPTTPEALLAAAQRAAETGQPRLARTYIAAADAAKRRAAREAAAKAALHPLVQAQNIIDAAAAVLAPLYGATA